jgi:hypothetical protein
VAPERTKYREISRSPRVVLSAGGKAIISIVEKTILAATCRMLSSARWSFKPRVDLVNRIGGTIFFDPV